MNVCWNLLLNLCDSVFLLCAAVGLDVIKSVKLEFTTLHHPNHAQVSQPLGRASTGKTRTAATPKPKQVHTSPFICFSVFMVNSDMQFSVGFVLDREVFSDFRIKNPMLIGLPEVARMCFSNENYC